MSDTKNNADGDHDIGSTIAALDIRNVSHAFGRKKALDDVSFDVRQGRLTALLGINGAGKTTLFSLITRLYDNVSGRIAVCGYDIRDAPGPALARTGVVFQNRSLDASLSVRQNMQYHAALHGIGRRESQERSELVLKRVGLQDKTGANVRTLSGGQIRRAEIARALLHDPALLLLDEATVGLDVQSRRDVISVVRTLVSEHNVGVLWATHLFDEIEPQDDVVILHEGRVLARDTAAEIMGSQSLNDAFLARTGVVTREERV